MAWSLFFYLSFIIYFPSFFCPVLYEHYILRGLGDRPAPAGAGEVSEMIF